MVPFDVPKRWITVLQLLGIPFMLMGLVDANYTSSFGLMWVPMVQNLMPKSSLILR